VVLPSVEVSDALREILLQRHPEISRIFKGLKGEPRRMSTLAQANAEDALKLLLNKDNVRQERLEALRMLLELKALPRLIVGFDMSHLQGSEPVGAMVAFVEARPQKSLYRHFKVKSGARDDFGQMTEVLRRFMLRVKKGEYPRPDLVLLDGGPAQLSAYQHVQVELEEDIPVVALAKARFQEDKRSPERLYIPGNEKAVIPDQHDPGLHLLMAVRDEAHRFAGRYQKTRRKQRMKSSPLEEVEGIGKKRRKALLTAFGSIEAIREATAQEISQKTGIPQKIAQRLLKRLKDEPE